MKTLRLKYPPGVLRPRPVERRQGIIRGTFSMLEDEQLVLVLQSQGKILRRRFSRSSDQMELLCEGPSFDALEDGEPVPYYAATFSVDSLNVDPSRTIKVTFERQELKYPYETTYHSAR